MNMSVKNKNISVGKMEVGDVSSSSLVLIGDTEMIVSSSIFDTPSHSLLFSPELQEPQKSS